MKIPQRIGEDGALRILLAAVVLGCVSAASLAAQASSPGTASGRPSGPAEVVFVRPPISLWWEGLSPLEKRLALAKYPALAESFAFHKKMMPQPKRERLVTDKSLDDWWAGLDEKETARIMKEQPRLVEAVKAYRERLAKTGGKPDAAKSRRGRR